MEITLQKGTHFLTATLPDSAHVLSPKALPAPICSEEEILERALARPIGSPALGEMLRPGMKVAVITSDITRPMPSDRVVPVVLRALWAAGISPEDVTVVLALGSHAPHTEAQRRTLLGDAVLGAVRCLDSDPDDCVTLGETSIGTPVDVFRPVAHADVVICLGNLEYHYFMGYSGGIKAVMPGVSSLRAISHNHAGMLKPGAKAGEIARNPVRLDIEEAVSLLPPIFLLNVVLDEHHHIRHAVAGDVILAHRAGCLLVDELYAVPIPHRYDLVVVSPGGYPKDMNMYQAQKALENAGHAVKDGGVILWVASCGEGLGSGVFGRWMTEKSDPEILSDIQTHFELGGHKAAAIAALRGRASVCLVSDLGDEEVTALGFSASHSVEAALAWAYGKLPESPGILVMPQGGSTLPKLMPADERPIS